MRVDVHATKTVRRLSGTASESGLLRPGFCLLMLVAVLLPSPSSAESPAAEQTLSQEAPTQSATVAPAVTPPSPDGSGTMPANPPQEGQAPAEQNRQDGAQPQAPTPPEEPTMVDTIHAGISKSILATSSWLDSFFYDPRYAAEENRTRAIFRYDIFDESHQRISAKARVLFKVVLPQMKNKAHLIIAGDPDEQTEEQTEAGVTAPSRPDASKDRNVSSSLGYFFKSNERRNISARMGLRYRNGHFVLFVRPHYRVLYDMGSWKLRFTQEVPYWTDKGWESLTAVDLERQFKNQFFFRTSLVGHWYEDRNGYFYSLIFSFIQPLSPRRALHYDWTNDFQTRPDRLQQIAVSVRYRQLIWKDWLYFDIAPQMRFPRNRVFDFVPGILFRIEMLFGKY